MIWKDVVLWAEWSPKMIAAYNLKQQVIIIITGHVQNVAVMIGFILARKTEHFYSTATKVVNLNNLSKSCVTKAPIQSSRQQMRSRERQQGPPILVNHCITNAKELS